MYLYFPDMPRSSTTEQREQNFAFPWQNSKVVYCWYLHVGQQQYEQKVLGVSAVKIFTRKRHDITLYVHYIPCFSSDTDCADE